MDRATSRFEPTDEVKKRNRLTTYIVSPLEALDNTFRPETFSFLGNSQTGIVIQQAHTHITSIGLPT